MSFSIRLLPAEVKSQDARRIGEIRIGAFVERFAVYPVAATVDDPEIGWRRELGRLVAGEATAALSTASNKVWIFYRFGREVRVHENLIVPGWEGALGPTGLIARVPLYRSVAEDGYAISEWTTTVDAVWRSLP